MSTSIILPISLIIPCFNEATIIEAFLQSLKLLVAKPDEIIFIDAGSSDDTNTIISQWFMGNDIASKHRIVGGERAYPGKARNVGIKEAKNSWIAFLDVGVIPDSNWLGNLFRYVKEHDEIAAWGVCKGVSKGRIGQAICAVSFGADRFLDFVIPASLFSREVFENVGYFPENLRATEDIIWRKAFLERYGLGRQCFQAKVYYNSFPSSLSSAAKKWFIYAIHTAISKVKLVQELVYLTFYMISLALLLILSKHLLWMFLTYLVLRGVVDPIYRSKQINWFSGDIRVFLLAIVVVFVLDLSKTCGFLVGNLKYIFNYFKRLFCSATN